MKNKYFNYRKTSLTTTVFVFVILVFFSCRTKQEIKSKEVLVQLFNDTSVVSLEKRFSKYHLKKQKVVSRPMYIFLFSYHSEKIQENAMIDSLKASAFVKEAQSNKDVQIRN